MRECFICPGMSDHDSQYGRLISRFVILCLFSRFVSSPDRISGTTRLTVKNHEHLKHLILCPHCVLLLLLLSAHPPWWPL